MEKWAYKIPFDEISVPEELQPVNPEDEDNVIPDQHAAFGIAKATSRFKEPAWRDLDLDGLLKQAQSAKETSTSKRTRMPR